MIHFSVYEQQYYKILPSSLIVLSITTFIEDGLGSVQIEQHANKIQFGK